MSDFKLLFPDISYSASLTSSHSVSSATPLTNTRGGSYTDGVSFANTGTQADIMYSLSTAQACDFIVLGKVDHVRDADSSDPTLTFFHNTSATYTGATSTNFTLSSANCVGSENDMFVSSVSVTGTKPWYAARIATTETFAQQWGKVFLGQAVDLGREPNPIRFDSAFFLGNHKKIKRKFRLVFEGVEGSAKNNLMTRLKRFGQYTPCFFWDSQDRNFYGDKLVYGFITDYRLTVNVRESWTINLEVREII